MISKHADRRDDDSARGAGGLRSHCDAETGGKLRDDAGREFRVALLSNFAARRERDSQVPAACRCM